MSLFTDEGSQRVPKCLIFLNDLASVLQDYHYHAVIALKHVLSNCAGYAEVKSEVVYGKDFCNYNCTVDHSIALKCQSRTNISVKSSPSATNKTLKTPSGVDYTISDLRRCQRYTVQVTAQVGAHKYTNQTEDTVMLGKSA